MVVSTEHPLHDDETTDANVRQRAGRVDPMIGRVFDGRYRILDLIARGGMGRVYTAEQAPLGRRVAVKVLDVGGHDDREFRQRFIREAEICARLSHPNTVRVLDYGRSEDDVLYIAMELLEGRNLFQAIQTDAPMDALRVVRIGLQIAASLGEAHRLGLIHRDLKPSNIILLRPSGNEEFVKVVDFGLAKEISDGGELTRADALVGSPSYMSPEQVRSASLDQRSDLYALGVLMYACCCGRPPFTGATPLAILMGHLNQPPPPMSQVCPSMRRVPALEAVIDRCLAKEPEARYPDMDAVLAALNLVEDELRGSNPRVFVGAPAAPQRVGAPTPVPPQEPTPKTRPVTYGLMAVTLAFGLLAILSAGGLGVWFLTPRVATQPVEARVSATPTPIQIVPAAPDAPATPEPVVTPPSAVRSTRPATAEVSAIRTTPAVVAPGSDAPAKLTPASEPPPLAATAPVSAAAAPVSAATAPVSAATAPVSAAAPPVSASAAATTAVSPTDTPPPEPTPPRRSDVRDPWEKR